MKHGKGPHEDVLFSEASQQDHKAIKKNQNKQVSLHCYLKTNNKQKNSHQTEQLELSGFNLGRLKTLLLFYTVLLYDLFFTAIKAKK